MATRYSKPSSLHRGRATTTIQSRPRELAVQSEPLACKPKPQGIGPAFVFIQLTDQKWFIVWKDPHGLAPELDNWDMEYTPKFKNYTAGNHHAMLAIQSVSPGRGSVTWSILTPHYQGWKYIHHPSAGHLCNQNLLNREPIACNSQKD